MTFKTALRRAAFLAVVLSVCLAATAPAPSCADGPPKRVLFVNPGYADKGFWKAVSDTMAAAASVLGFELTIVSGDRKWPLMVSRGMAALKDLKPDYAILVNEHQQAPQLMAAAEVEGIKTILLLNGLTADQETRMRGQGKSCPIGWVRSHPTMKLPATKWPSRF